MVYSINGIVASVQCIVSSYPHLHTLYTRTQKNTNTQRLTHTHLMPGNGKVGDKVQLLDFPAEACFGVSKDSSSVLPLPVERSVISRARMTCRTSISLFANLFH